MTHEIPELKHGMADIARDVRLHYLDAGLGSRTAVLLHGFPETSHEWRKLIPSLVDSSFRVIAPDYRGAGGSSKPAAGYEKHTMAGDIRALLREHLGVQGPVVMIGHDMGAMIAFAYAMRYREEISHLVLIDTLLAGTKALQHLAGDSRGWHAAFHNARDIAELLVQGRERAYLQQMFSPRIYDPSAISHADFDAYVRAYEAPGAMRAGFELYRAFEADARELQSQLAQSGKLTIPTLAIGGETSGLTSILDEMMREVAERPHTLVAPHSGHWVPEENPAFVAAALAEFLSK